MHIVQSHIGLLIHNSKQQPCNVHDSSVSQMRKPRLPGLRPLFKVPQPPTDGIGSHLHSVSLFSPVITTILSRYCSSPFIQSNRKLNKKWSHSLPVLLPELGQLKTRFKRRHVLSLYFVVPGHQSLSRKLVISISNYIISQEIQYLVACYLSLLS